MRDYPEYEQRDAGELAELYDSQPTCLLVTRAGRCGVFNHVRLDRKFYLHLSRPDEQLADLRKEPRAKLVFQDILAIIPSYWVEESYGGAATTYYRYAELDCAVRLLEKPEEQTPVYEGLLRKHQPEGGFAKLDPASPLYASSYRALVVVECDPTQVRTKWKIGQNRPEEVRLRVAAKLEERARGGDLRAASEIRKWVRKPPSPDRVYTGV